MSISAIWVHALVEAVEAVGVRRENLLKTAAMDPARLDDIDARVERDEYNRLLAAALDITGDDALGIHMGELTSPMAFDVVGQVAAHASTMREAIAGLLRFHRITTDDPEPVLKEEKDTATLVCRVPPSAPRCDRLRAEFAVVRCLGMVHYFAGRHQSLAGAVFEHDAPSYRKEYTRIFGGTEQFGNAFTGVVFDRQFLDYKRHARHTEVYAAMSSLAERKLTRITRGLLAPRLVEFLASQPLPISVDMKAAARWVGISARSLRRKLEEEQTSFTGVLTEARAKLATRMLEAPERSICEIAYALGFSETSAFYRAFKRWTGMTPAAYRAKF